MSVCTPNPAGAPAALSPIYDSRSAEVFARVGNKCTLVPYSGVGAVPASGPAHAGMKFAAPSRNPEPNILTAETAMADPDFDTLLELLHEFDTAMLVTSRDQGLRSRPMAIADTTRDGRIRFITRDDSGKLDELLADDNVNVAMQGDSRFLSVSGKARLSREPELIDASWQGGQSPWFAQGRNDPHVIVLEVIPTFAEFWDRSGLATLQLLFERTRHALAGGSPADEQTVGRHGRVDFRARPYGD